MKSDRADATLALLLFLAAAAAFAWWATSDELGSVGGDNAVYVLTARHYSPLLPADPIARTFAEQSQYPPLYPLSFALVAESLASVHLITALELALAIAMIFVWSVVAGLNRGIAVAATLLLAVMPGTYLEALQIHSEPLYLALSVLALLRIEIARQSGRVRDDVILTLLVTAAALTRTAGISLFVPLALALRGRPIGVWVRCAFAASPFALWHLAHMPTHSYTSVLAHNAVDASRLVSWHGLAAIRHGWAENLVVGSAMSVVADILFAACLLAALRRAWRGRADGWYVITYLVVIALWNFPAEATRFVWVIVPVLIVQLLLEVEALAARVLPNAVVLAVVGICVTPAAALAAQRVERASTIGVPAARHVPEWFRADPGLAEEDTITYLSLMQALAHAREAVPVGECIQAIKPSVVALITGRRSISPPPASVPDEAFAAGLAQTDCRYFLMMAYRPPSFPEAMYPQRRVAGRVEELFRQTAELSGGATGEVAILARLR